MTKKKTYSLSCRIDEDINRCFESIMKKEKLKNKTEVVEYLINQYENSGSNINPFYRNTIGWLAMKMETALNEIDEGQSVAIGRKVLEEFKCLILS